MKISVLAIGELLADIITENYVSSLSQARTFRLYQGGSPANVCANLNWMGTHAVMVGCIGEDGIGHNILESIKEIGLDDVYISRSKIYPTSIVMVGRSKGTPDFVAYRMADAQIGPIDKALVEKSAMIHSGAFALSRNPAQRNILDALQLAVDLGKMVSIDWNFTQVLWQDDGKETFKKVCENRPLLKMSLDDVERFMGRSVLIQEALDFLSTLTTTVTCLTCGENGVWFRDDVDAVWKFQPAVSVSNVIDTTGAGDAFWSGFLNAYLQHRPTAACINDGLNMAAKKIQKLGPLYIA